MWTTLLLIGGIMALNELIGVIAAAIVAGCAVGVLIALWMSVVAVIERRYWRAEQALTGTWIHLVTQPSSTVIR